MGRQARIKRERARQRGEAPQPQPEAARDAGSAAEPAAPDDGPVILTASLPGAEHLADADGLFHDCEICRALRRGDNREARRLIRQESRRQAWEMRRSSN